MHLYTFETKLGWKIALRAEVHPKNGRRRGRQDGATIHAVIYKCLQPRASQFIDLNQTPPTLHGITTRQAHQRLPGSIPEMQIAALLSDLKSLSACVCHVASISVTSHPQSLSCTLLIPPPCPAHLPEALGSRLSPRPSDGPPQIPATNSTKPRPYYYSVAIEDG
jgi:hypothetical protein